MIDNDIILSSRADGLEIGVRLILPDRRPCAVLQLSHGMCGCKERFLPFMQYMAEHGVACIANDHRGHGASVKHIEDLGYMYSSGYKGLVADMKMVSDHIRSIFPDVPFFLLGHSMGSLAARVYFKNWDNDVDGLILCGTPFNRMHRAASLFLRILCLYDKGRMRLPMIQRISSDRFNRRFASEGRQAWTCSDPQVRKAFQEDPVCGFDFTANGAYNLMAMMGDACSDKGWSCRNTAAPVALLYGEEDPCTEEGESIRRALSQFHSQGYGNVIVRSYPSMRHEILNEIGKEQVWDDILDIMKKASE